MNRKPCTSFGWKQAVGFLCLSVYLFGGTKILPAMLAFAAQLEGSHKVLVGSSASAFDLRLHHQERSVTSKAWANHQHGLASKMFCALASSQDADPDHILHFASAFISESPSAEMALSSSSAFPIEAIETVLWSVCAVPTERKLVKAHPPARAPAHLAELRATVLVV